MLKKIAGNEGQNKFQERTLNVILKNQNWGDSYLNLHTLKNFTDIHTYIHNLNNFFTLLIVNSIVSTLLSGFDNVFGNIKYYYQVYGSSELFLQLFVNLKLF